MFAPYQFAANSPLITIDKDGRDIWIVGKVFGVDQPVKFEAGKAALDGSDEFITSSWNAVNDFINSGSKGALSLATDENVKLTVQETDGITAYNGSGSNEGILNLNPNLGFISVELSNPMKPKRSNEFLDLKDKKRWFSPKRSFKHEIGHAIHDLIDGTANIDRNENATEPGYEQLEDEKTIKENDQGDKLRNNHAGVVYDADCFDRETGTPRIDTNKKGDLINPVSGAKIIKKE